LIKNKAIVAHYIEKNCVFRYLLSHWAPSY
jgi:hypothetical protein